MKTAKNEKQIMGSAYHVYILTDVIQDDMSKMIADHLKSLSFRERVKIALKRNVVFIQKYN